MKGKSLTMIGTAITLALTTNVAHAQSSKSPIDESSKSAITSPTEIKLSPEGMKILCERFPLNSRCPGGTAINAATPSNTKIPEAQPAEDNTTPDGTLVPTTLTEPDPGNRKNPTPAPGSPTSSEAGDSGKVTPATFSPTVPTASSPSQIPDTGSPQIPASR